LIRKALPRQGEALTYLSISSMLKLEAAEIVARYVPTVADRGDRKRIIWVTPTCLAQCRPDGPHADSRVGDEALIALQDVLNAFVFYDEMVEHLDMTWLDTPDAGVWEFRSYSARPQLRLFGSFVVPSHFLGTAFRVRDDLEDGRGPRWDRAIDEAITIRNSLLPNPPYVGGSFGDHLI
jgi:hypothetical protein